MFSTPCVRSLIQHIGDLLALWPRSTNGKEFMLVRRESEGEME
jgi:hypothetical protein